MKIIKINGRLTTEEKETVLSFNYDTKMWYMDTTVLKHYNKAKNQAWTQTTEYVYDDGSVCGGVFEAPERAVTIRNTSKKQMTDKQLQNLLGNEED